MKKTVWIFVLFLVATTTYSQIPDTAQPQSNELKQIRLNTYVEESQVPLNGVVKYHIEVTWNGDLSRYQIEPVSQPSLKNLLLKGSGSENKLEPLGNGQFRAIKSITYRFEPLEMGMAYIDGVVIKYVDRQTNKEDQLTSQRVMVEIIDPVPEQGEGGVRSFIYISLLILFFAVTFYFLFVYFKKKKQSRKSPVTSVPLSELYLTRLAQEVDPRGTNLREMTARLSKIFREYLDAQFGIHSRESSTHEIKEQLQNLDIDETDRDKLLAVFDKLDLYKFAGKNMNPADFTDIYGSVEAFLIKRKQMQNSNHVELKEEG